MKAPAPIPIEPIAIAASNIRAILPDVSPRSWFRYDAAGKCPAGFMLAGRKLWRVEDLRQWAALGFPDRATFERKTGAHIE